MWNFVAKGWSEHITITAYFHCSVLLTSALRTMTSVKALLVPARPPCNPNLMTNSIPAWSKLWYSLPIDELLSGNKRLYYHSHRWRGNLLVKTNGTQWCKRLSREEASIIDHKLILLHNWANFLCVGKYKSGELWFFGNFIPCWNYWIFEVKSWFGHITNVCSLS